MNRVHWIMGRKNQISVLRNLKMDWENDTLTSISSNGIKECSTIKTISSY